MKRLAILLLGLSVGSALAQAPEGPPRVTGEDEAAGAEIILNELNAESYPDMLVLATVLRDGAPLTGLTASDFRVREDEVDQEPLTVEPQLPPLSVVVALDSSGSMSRRMGETQAAAKQFVEGLGEGDSVQLLRFARDIETMTPMTTTKDSVSEAIDTVVARGDTALYDGLHQSIELLADRRGRRAVVLLSDGVDDDGTGQPLSERTIDDVLAAAEAGNVPVFVIGLGTEMDEATLSSLAEETGAQYLNAPEASELATVYGQISDQLSGQYAIRYTSSLPADGTSRRVDIAALGSQDSRTYTAEGSAKAPPAPVAVAAGECAPSQAMTAERGALEQAKERYDGNLIAISDRDAVREGSVERMQAAVDGADADLACVRESLEIAREFYDENLIAISARDALREGLVSPLLDICDVQSSIDGTVTCLTFMRDGYDENMFDISTRDRLRGDTFEQLVALYVEDTDADEALAELGALYDDNLISITQRDGGRAEVLRASE